MWIDEPWEQFLCASTTDDNAARDSSFCRNALDNPLYWNTYVQRGDMPPKWKIIPGRDNIHKFQTTANGWREATSVNSTVVGSKSDFQLLDDPNDPKKIYSRAERLSVARWYFESFYNRTNDYRKAKRISIGQHTGPDDLFSQMKDRHAVDVVLKLEERKTSIHVDTPLWKDDRTEGEYLRPERFSESEEKENRLILGNNAYEAQHQQNPKKREGRLFKAEKVRLIPLYPIPIAASRYYDIASSKDDEACWTCGVLAGMHNGRFVVIHANRGHWSPRERDDTVRDTTKLDMVRPGIQYSRTYFEKQPGPDQSEYLIIHCAGLPVEAVRPEGDKFVRAEPLATYWDSGLVDVVEGTWNVWFLDYMESFDRGAPAHMLDVGDATSGIFNKAVKIGTPIEAEAGEQPEYGDNTYRYQPGGQYGY